MSDHIGHRDGSETVLREHLSAISNMTCMGIAEKVKPSSAKVFALGICVFGDLINRTLNKVQEQDDAKQRREAEVARIAEEQARQAVGTEEVEKEFDRLADDPIENDRNTRERELRDKISRSG